MPAGAAALIHGMAKCIYTRGCTGVRLAFAAIVFVFQLLISSKLFNFCFGKQSLFFFPAHPPCLVVRHDSIAYRHSDGTSIFRVVSSCFAGTDVVHPYTATSRVRFIRGPVVTRKRRGVGRQRVMARSDYRIHNTGIFNNWFL